MANGMWFQVDMQAAQTFDQITMDSGGSANDYARGLQVFVSSDGVDFGAAIASGTGASAVETVQFPTQSARYIKIVQTGAASNWWSIAELNVYTSGASDASAPPQPAPPSALSATATSSSSIALSWSASSTPGVTYDVFRGTSASFTPSSSTLIASGLAGLTYLDSGLAASTTYYYFVEAVSSGVSSLPSKEASAPTPTPPDAGPAETALSRVGWVATASNTGGADAPARVLDGNSATRWSTGAPMANGMWLQVDMQATQSFDRITMDSGGSANDYARGYEVFVSNDGVNFGNPIASGSATSALVTVTFAPQNARYLKIVQTGAASFWWSIAELNVYSPAAASDAGVMESPLPRSGWVPTASNTGGADAPARALDGSSATRWSSGAPMANGMWFQVDMQATQSFSQITMDSGGSANDYARGYQVFVSSDGVNFGNPIAAGSGASALVTVTFAPQSARYVKIVQTGAASFWWSIAELNVYHP
jgi:acyl-CoA hydrolase